MSNHGQQNDRRNTEIALLQAMYPLDITWHEQRREIIYKPEAGGLLTLRIPDDYPGETVQPILIEALDRHKDDIRNTVRKSIDALGLPSGEEILDAIIQAFEEVIRDRQEAIETSNSTASNDENIDNTHKTVIIWLHHLLNTNKRKLTITPSLNPSQISGLTKPGYPGILLYSGPTASIDAHVLELKSQRWQAFQVRLEEVSDGDGVWRFAHEEGVKEVESMSEVVQGIVEEGKKDVFLRCVGVK